MNTPVAPARILPAQTLPTRVLVVDDDEDLLAMEVSALLRAGYEADATSDPRVAVQWIREHRRDWDVLISDLDMPYLRGSEVVRALKTHQPHAMSIICTGSNDTSTKTPEEEPDAVLMKPCRTQDLIALVEELAHVRH